MDKTARTPLWVMLAFSSIEKRKSALWLIWACVAFTAYCVPWPVLFSKTAWIAKVFLIDDWSWLAMMVPIVLWYLACLRGMDSHQKWPTAE